jgi:hypothetical protein
MSPLSRSLLEKARPGLTPSLAHRKQMRDSILERVANAAAPETTRAGYLRGVLRLATANTTKIALVSLVALGSGAFVSTARSVDTDSSSSTDSSAAPMRASNATATATATATASLAPVETAAARSESFDVAPSIRATAEPPSSGSGPRAIALAAPEAVANPDAEPTANPPRALEDEYRLIDMAYSAVSAGQSERALALLEAHALGFPRGQLVQQRERLRVEALVATHRLDEARDAAALFRRHFPNGILRPSVERALTEKGPSRLP